MVSSVLFLIFPDRLNWLAAFRLDPTAAHMKTDLLKGVYEEMSYTIWAMGLKKKEREKGKTKKKIKREKKLKLVEHFQDGDEVVFPSLLCLYFIRFDIWAYSLVQRVNKWPL